MHSGHDRAGLQRPGGQRPGATELRSPARHVCSPDLCRFYFVRTAGRARRLGMWAREPRERHGSCSGIKESVRWVQGYERLPEMAAELPSTRLVYLADREADIMELMRRTDSLGTPVDWLLRSRHNRTVKGSDKLWSAVMCSEVLGEIRFVMAPRKSQRASEVVLAKCGHKRCSCPIARAALCRPAVS